MTPTERFCSDPEQKRDRKHRGGCGRSLRREEHLCKCEDKEKKGKIHWLCHKCAKIPCPFEGAKPRAVPALSQLREQRRYIRMVIGVLEQADLTKFPEQAERLEKNRKVLQEIDRRIKLIRH